MTLLLEVAFFGTFLEKKNTGPVLHMGNLKTIRPALDFYDTEGVWFLGF